jgi:hypothetical protein
MLVELGRLDEAQALADELIHALADGRGEPWMVIGAAWVADEVGLADALREFLRTVGSVRRSDAADILEANFEALAERAGQEGRNTIAARARLRAAERLVAEGRRAEADAHLSEALGFYRSVGATRYVREAEALLVAAS